MNDDTRKNSFYEDFWRNLTYISKEYRINYEFRSMVVVTYIMILTTFVLFKSYWLKFMSVIRFGKKTILANDLAPSRDCKVFCFYINIILTLIKIK